MSQPATAAVRAIPRQPSFAARDAVRSAIRALLAESFDYREAMGLLKSHLVDVALEQSGRSPKKASERMHVSRQLVHAVRAHAKEIGL